jgi:hypothetical protein
MIAIAKGQTSNRTSDLGLAATPVRVGNSKPLQNVALKAFHGFCVFLPLVVVSQQMQKPMHRKMGDMMGKWLVFRLGFRCDGFVGQDHVTDEQRIAAGTAGWE